MCGIAGIARNHIAPTDVEMVREMCRVLKHRGPDDLGVYEGKGCLLGQTRLSIIDLAGGHQPLCNEDGSVWVAFNGEVYNFVELREALITRGHQFRTSTDTEVIVHLHEEYGISLVEKLNGMYAFALWDQKTRTLFLVRDRLGIKPLYYRFRDGSLAFASELKALLVERCNPLPVDKEALADYLTLSYIPEPRTPFEKIRKLPKGSYLSFSEGKVRIQKYWLPPTENLGTAPPLDEICDEMIALLEDSVRIQLRADVPVGVFASGGLDSSTILWAASRQNVSLEAFLMEFDQLAVDTPYARLAAEANGMKLTEEHLSSEEAGKLLPKLIWHLDEPLADPAILPCYLIAREAAKRVKVILNGTGGDELFGGYHRYNVRSLLPDSLTRCLRGFLYEISHLDPFLHRATGLLDYQQRYLRRLSIFPEHAVRRALGLQGKGEVSRKVHHLFQQGAGNDRPGSMMFVDLNLYLPDDLFMMLDKMTMAVSLEARVPLLDHRLVEFMCRIPGRLKMQGGELKWLLRRALRGMIPDMILDRPKQGFGPPIPKWISGSMGDSALAVLKNKDSRVKDLLGTDRITSWIGDGRRKSPVEAVRIWSLLNLEIWWRIFVEKRDFGGAGLQEMAHE